MAKAISDGADGATDSKRISGKKRSRKDDEDRNAAGQDADQDGVAATGKSETKEERRERKRLKKLKKLASATESESAHDADEGTSAAQTPRSSAVEAAEEELAPKTGASSNGLSSQSTASQIATTTAYVEHPDLTRLDQSAIDSFMAKNFISIKDPHSATKSPRPIIEFSYLPDENQQRTALQKFSAPTPIQAASWPFLFQGRDVVGIAETGSGKTMAFALPCVRYIAALPKGRKGPKALVVSPTRELAMQSHEQIAILADATGMKTACIYGGVPKDEQRKALKHAEIIVATPGRLSDLMNEGSTDLSTVAYMVLDEADRMLDKGFEEEIRKIIQATKPPADRQTLMFTATWPESVRSLAATFMKSPVMITIGDNPTGDLRANTRIVQKVEVVDPRNKEYRLLQLLKQYQSGSQKDDRILVFCLYKKEATRVEGFIRSKGIKVAGIHGDLSQEQRTKSLDAFKKGITPVLVATDVAARGLDIPAVKLVINVTFPLTVEDYVHRIGRTGRAGKEGLAITLFTEHDKAQSGALINVLKAANQPVPDELLKFGTTVKKKGHDAYGAFFKDVDTTKTATKIKFD